MKSARTSLLAFAVLLFAGCGTGTPPPLQYATVSATVVDSTTQRPIANATLTVNGVQSATTNAQGLASVANVPNGPFDYFISAPGYQQLQGSGTASPGQTASLGTIALTPAR